MKMEFKTTTYDLAFDRRLAVDVAFQGVVGVGLVLEVGLEGGLVVAVAEEHVGALLERHR